MKICTYYVSRKHEDIRWLCKGTSRWSGRAVGYWSWWRHQQCKAIEVTDVIASHTVSQFMTIWKGPMADFYHAQQNALDMLLKECDFVSGFVVRFVASWTCSRLGGERRWCCLLQWSIHPRPSMTSTLTLTLTLTPTEIGNPLSSPVSLSGRVPL